VGGENRKSNSRSPDNKKYIINNNSQPDGTLFVLPEHAATGSPDAKTLASFMTGPAAAFPHKNLKELQEEVISKIQ